MFRGLVGIALIVGAAPVSAATYYATVKGTVTQQTATMFTTAGATSPIKVGDTITATFSSVNPTSVGEALGAAMGGGAGQKVTFKIGDYTWSSLGDFAASFEPISFNETADPLAGYYSTMDDAPGAGDLRIDGYAFEIGEFGYGVYTGPGFKGVFDQSTLVAYQNGKRIGAPERFAASFAAAVPEPFTWAMMIGGFGLAGTAIRSRRAVRARFA